jgi:signal transduction histidine kinase
VSAVLLTTVAALAIIYGLMRPPLREFGLLACFLSVTAAVSIGAGYAAYKLGWIRRSPRLSLALLGGYALSSVLTFLNVWFTALLMFSSAHDLLLATVLLLFAGGIAMSLGYFLSVSLIERIATLSHAAGEFAHGRFGTRVADTGRDELGELARSFNMMAQRLEVAERQRRELDQLRRDLVAWVGHDLRTPLTSLRVIVESLADGVIDDPATVQRYLGTARKQIRALSLLLDDLFELAQIDAGGLKLERQDNSLGDLISDTMEAFSALAARRGVALAGFVAPGVDPVHMDARQIGRVLANLVDNALRYTESGGTVQVEASSEPDGVRVEVQDDGEGVREADLPHLFERFYRAEKSRSRDTGGAGLGLAISRGIVEAHGGQIGARSKVGEGTSVWFVLPR